MPAGPSQPGYASIGQRLEPVVDDDATALAEQRAPEEGEWPETDGATTQRTQVRPHQQLVDPPWKVQAVGGQRPGRAAGQRSPRAPQRGDEREHRAGVDEGAQAGAIIRGQDELTSRAQHPRHLAQRVAGGVKPGDHAHGHDQLEPARLEWQRVSVGDGHRHLPREPGLPDPLRGGIDHRLAHVDGVDVQAAPGERLGEMARAASDLQYRRPIREICRKHVVEHDRLALLIDPTLQILTPVDSVPIGCVGVKVRRDVLLGGGHGIRVRRSVAFNLAVTTALIHGNRARPRPLNPNPMHLPRPG